MQFVFLLIDFDRYTVRFKDVTQDLNARQIFCIIANPDHFDQLPDNDGLRGMLLSVRFTFFITICVRVCASLK